jgi:hypothetical protein
MGTLLGEREIFLFDQRNVEVLRLAGTPNAVLWAFASYSVSGDADCLYEEPIPGSNHYFPFKVMCWFEQPSAAAESSDEGRQNVLDAVFYFSRKNLETINVPLDSDKNHVRVGDIVELFSKDKVKRWFFQIKNVERNGFLNDSRYWTQYKCEAIRYDQFNPERQLDL